MQLQGYMYTDKQTSPTPSIVTVDQEVKEAAIALAQLSVAREVCTSRLAGYRSFVLKLGSSG